VGDVDDAVPGGRMTRSREVQARGWRKLALAALYPVRVLAGGKP
jgi:hypothetical protein